MKILTKQEEEEHYQATVKGGAFGGTIGLLGGTAAILIAQRRYPGFRSLTLPFKTFLAVSGGTFSAIIAADRAGRAYEEQRQPDRNYEDEAAQLRDRVYESKTVLEKAREWANENRYSLVFGSWVASMGTSFAIVQRNRYLTGAQKLVQARVYAQGLTLAVLLASLALEANDKVKKQGRWETIKVLDPKDPEHKRLIEKRVHHERYRGEDQWMDMVAAEERRAEERKNRLKREQDKVKAATTGS